MHAGDRGRAAIRGARAVGADAEEGWPRIGRLIAVLVELPHGVVIRSAGLNAGDIRRYGDVVQGSGGDVERGRCGAGYVGSSGDGMWTGGRRAPRMGRR